MNIRTTLLSAVVLTTALSAPLAMAKDNPQSDAREADESTVVRKVVNYRCDLTKALKVTYGFNKQGEPTYAQAFLSGKTRFMPINLYLSDLTGTHFGDDNNFSLSTIGGITSKKYRAGIQVQSPASEMIYKSCTAR